MPIKVTNPSKTGGLVYGNPVVGDPLNLAQILVVLSGFSNKEIDADGYLKPGVPIAADGTLVGAAEPVFGVTMEALKVTNGNDATALAAAGSQQVGLMTQGQVNQDIMEDNLDRVLTAAEIAGFNLAGSQIKLL